MIETQTQALLERRRRAMGPTYRLFYDQPVHVARAEGVWMYDPEGNAYLDVYNNVPSVGHCHPAVVEAIAKQAAKLNTHTRYLYDMVVEYAEKLLSTFPAELSQVMLTCTGSEAADLAMRVARAYTGNTGFITTSNAYHGVTASLCEITPAPGRTLAPYARTVPAPDTYRTGGRDIASIFAENVDRAIRDMAAHGIKPAALMIDTIFGSDGTFTDPPGFLAEAIALVREAGGIYVADEVQPGFARTGTHMWGHLRHGVVADAVVLGKPAGNGLPVAGLVARPELLERFAASNGYFNTFGGNPVCSAAALAVLEVIEREGLMENARIIGARMLEGVKALTAGNPHVGDCRGAGLFLGVEMVSDRETKTPSAEMAAKVVNGMRAKRVLIGASGASRHVLKIRPPLPFTTADADHFLAAFGEVIAELH